MASMFTARRILEASPARGRIGLARAFNPGDEDACRKWLDTCIANGREVRVLMAEADNFVSGVSVPRSMLSRSRYICISIRGDEHEAVRKLAAIGIKIHGTRKEGAPTILLQCNGGLAMCWKLRDAVAWRIAETTGQALADQCGGTAILSLPMPGVCADVSAISQDHGNIYDIAELTLPVSSKKSAPEPIAADKAAKRLASSIGFLRFFQPGGRWVLRDSAGSIVLDSEDAARQWLADRIASNSAIELLLPEVSEDFEGGARDIDPSWLSLSHFIAVKIPGGSPAVQASLALRLPPATLTSQCADGVVVIWRTHQPATWAMTNHLSASIGRIFGTVPLMWLPLPGSIKASVVSENAHGVYDFWEFLDVVARLMGNAAPVIEDAPQPDASAGARPAAAPFTRASEAQETNTRFLIPDIAPVGHMGLIAGREAAGKTSITLDLAARVSTGREWFGQRIERGGVLVVETEALEGEIRTRLRACGADLSRIWIRGREKGALDLSGADMELIARQAEAMGGVKLLVLSPVLMHFGRGSSDDEAVRRRLAPVLTWAAQNSVAVLGIIHQPKGKPDLLAGAAGFRREARVLFMAQMDPSDGEPNPKRRRRLFACVESNVGPDDLAFAYRTEGVTLPGGVQTSRVVWIGRADSDHGPGGPETFSNDPQDGGRSFLAAPARQDDFKATEWLRLALMHGARPQAEMLAEGSDLGFSQPTIYRHMPKAGVVGVTRPDGVRVWQLAE